jgi:hypothetical protein
MNYKSLYQLALKGDSKSQYDLGRFYFSGEKAFDW